MKTTLQHLLISFIGSLLALACFIGILQLIDNYNDETSVPLDEKVIAYFEDQEISYEKLEIEDTTDDLYSFSYNGNKYIWQYYQDDKSFLRIIKTYDISYEMDSTARVKCLELINQMERKLKCVKIVLREDWIYFSIECYVSRDGDIDNILSRGLDLLKIVLMKHLRKWNNFDLSLFGNMLVQEHNINPRTL